MENQIWRQVPLWNNENPSLHIWGFILFKQEEKKTKS